MALAFRSVMTVNDGVDGLTVTSNICDTCGGRLNQRQQLVAILLLVAFYVTVDFSP